MIVPSVHLEQERDFREKTLIYCKACGINRDTSINNIYK